MSRRKQAESSRASSRRSSGESRVLTRVAAGAFAMMAMAQRPARSFMPRSATYTPANQLYPRSSQKPPGNRLVTYTAVIHFGFLKPSLVGRRSLSG